MKLKFGVRVHDMAHNTNIEYLASILNKINIKYMQLVFPKALENCSYDEKNVLNIAKVLRKEKLKIAMLGAYFNPVHSSKEVVEKGINNFKENLRISKELGNPYVGSETGSYSDSPWTYVPKNHTEEGYNETLGVFKELVKYAEEVDAKISVEPAWNHVIYDVDTLKRFVGDLNSSHVYVTIDLFNLLYEGNFDSRDEIFEHALKTFGEQIKIIHLKDALIKEGKMVQVAPGEGDFHYPLMIHLIKRYCPNAVLVFEGVKPEKIESSYSYLLKIEEKMSDN